MQGAARRGWAALAHAAGGLWRPSIGGDRHAGLRRVLVGVALGLAAGSVLAAGYRTQRYGLGALLPWLLVSLAWMAAAVVYASRARCARRVGEQRLRAQYAIARILSDAATVEQATPRIMQAVCEALGWELGALWHTDADAGRLRFVDSWAPRSPIAAAFAADSRQAVLRHGEGMLGRCWSSASSVWVGDLEREPLVRRDLLLGLGFRSAFCFPITSSGEVIGVLEFLSSRRRNPDAELMAAVEAAGGQIGQFIQRRQAEAHADQVDRQRRSLLGRMLRGEQEERARIAGALHDDTIQVLTAALLLLDRTARSVTTGDRERARQAIAAARDTIQTATERARTLMFELRPPLLEAEGLASAVRDAADQAAADAGFTPIVETNVGRYPHPVEVLVYRTIQEALTNAKKHARASKVYVRLAEDDGALHGVIEDDGCGFDLDHALDRSRMRLHLGLDALAERIRLSGGHLTIDSRAGCGTRIEFRTPVHETARREPSSPARARRG
jgi:signal transduction histidine kinase